MGHTRSLYAVLISLLLLVPCAALPIVMIYISDAPLSESHYAVHAARVAAVNNPDGPVYLVRNGPRSPDPQQGILANQPNLVVVNQPFALQWRARMWKLWKRTVQPHWVENIEWEFNNLYRFAVLVDFLAQRNLSRAWFFDSDVLVVHRLPNDSALTCDSYVKMEEQPWESMKWVAWAGTAVLSVKTLEDFLRFTEALLTKNVDLLEQKATLRPSVCDMTFWYLFMVDHQRALYSKRSVCRIELLESGNLLFDMRDIDLQPGFSWIRPGWSSNTVYTVHFQGNRKQDLVAYVLTGKRAPGNKLLWVAMLALSVAAGFIWFYRREQWRVAVAGGIILLFVCMKMLASSAKTRTFI